MSSVVSLSLFISIMRIDALKNKSNAFHGILRLLLASTSSGIEIHRIPTNKMLHTCNVPPPSLHGRINNNKTINQPSCMHVPVLSSSSQIHTGIRKIRWLEMENHKFIASSSTLWIRMIAPSNLGMFACVRVGGVCVCVCIEKYVGS